jgi:hypothetical protein
LTATATLAPVDHVAVAVAVKDHVNDHDHDHDREPVKSCATRYWRRAVVSAGLHVMPASTGKRPGGDSDGNADISARVPMYWQARDGGES